MAMPHSSFYVTLNSHSNLNEFPDNKSHRFKNRLHHPLILREPGWRVGLCSICTPSAQPDLRDLSSLLTGERSKSLMKWSSWTDAKLTERTRKYVEESIEVAVEDMEKKGYVTSGVTMMKHFVDTYNRYIFQEAEKDDKRESSSGKKYYLDVKMDGNDMVIDNSNVHRSTGDGRPAIRFNKKLAFKMKWFEPTAIQHRTMPNIKLAPNLIATFYDPTIPQVLDVQNFNDLNATIFFKEDGDFIQLSVFCSWRFINLNEAFRSNWLIDDRTMHVMSDVVSSSIVADRTEDLLRTFHYKREKGYDMFHFDPPNVHYRPVRKAFFEVIETAFTETDEQEVKFYSGDCTITLHFKRDFLAT